MSNKRRVGQEIKSIAEILRAMIFIFYIIFAVVLLIHSIVLFPTDIEGGFLFLLFAIINGFGGYIVAKLATVTLYGFGELIDQIMIIQQSVCAMNNSTNEKLNVICAFQKTLTDTLSERKMNTSPESSDDGADAQGVAKPIVKQMTGENTVKCPICSCEQDDANYCIKCGARIKE